MLEQQITFGDGALRISALELRKEVDRTQKRIRESIQTFDAARPTLGDSLDHDIAEIFEKWRRNK